MDAMRTLLAIFAMIPMTAYSQNLLMNPGFEDENICTEYIKNCAPEGWISTSLWGDYYFNDPKNAFEGEHFVGLMYSGGKKTRDNRSHKFIRSRLLCGLRPGAQYRLEFHIRSFHSGLDSIGIHFSADDILFRKTPVVNDSPQLWVKNGLESSLTKQWQKVSLVYTAKGTEYFIAVGDFRQKELRFFVRPDLGDQYYYFIDDIRLVPVNGSEQLCDGAENIREEEYSFDPRHNVLDKLVYVYRKNPPPLVPPTRTIIQKVDTLVIPDVLFATNSFALNASASVVLDSFIANTRKHFIDSMTVEGHTDSTGTVSHNEVLSVNRAASVAAYLQPHFRASIITRGWASKKPIANNRSAAGRQKNRRVEIYLYTRE
jgi:outer membrane protein OmpA-like peptidoglycan-associated protein